MQSIPYRENPPKMPGKTPGKWRVIAVDDRTHDVLGVADVEATTPYRAKRWAEIGFLLDGKITHRSPYLLRCRKIAQKIGGTK